MMDLRPGEWVKHSITHPAEGFEDMRWKKAGSLKIAFAIVLLLFLAQIADGRLYGFQFGISYTSSRVSSSSERGWSATGLSAPSSTARAR